MKHFSKLFSVLIVTVATSAAAQVTLEEADDVMNNRNTELQAFQDRLNDPDPERALAILKLLIVKGDADQRRMAIRHGLQSTDSAIRATTVRAILDSEPTIVITFDPVSDEPDGYYARTIAQAGGIVAEDGTSEVTRNIAGFDDEEECWTYKQGVYNPCLAMMRGEVVSILFGGTWGSYTLNSKGELEGQQTITGNLAKGVIELYE